MSKKEVRLPPLKRRRLVLGKTLGEVAKDARITKQSMSHYENGVRCPHPHKIRDVAFALQLQPEQLVDLLGT